MDQIFKVKSITVSRKPGEDEDGYWSAFIGLFKDNNPHLKAKVPIKVLEIKDVEKVRVRELRNISFYLMGNDLIINNLEEIRVVSDNGVVTLSGKQKLPEEEG
ncbi:MAG TPA: hypothetical protein VJC39_02675 [Candidatus Nanoarchaeia archaeon]|nr:hypothetical protein [Candidatus Nanoarchaeia archaeon]